METENIKTLNTRIQHKHDTEANWNEVTSFIPKIGELIIYDTDDTHNYERIKIGDGKTAVTALPFYDDNFVTDDELQSIIAAIDYPVDSVNGKTGAVVLNAVDVGADASGSAAAAESAANEYTNQKIADLVNGAPETLDTLNELAAAMAENETVVEALNAAIVNKVSKTGDTMTGNLTILKSFPTLTLKNNKEDIDQRSAILNMGNDGWLALGNKKDDNNYTYLYMSNEGASNLNEILKISRKVNGGEAEGYKIYHEGNKPTVADVGAVNPNILHNWYFLNPIDQRGGYIVPAGMNSYSSSEFTTVSETLTSPKQVEVFDTYATYTVDAGTRYIKLSDIRRGYVGQKYMIDRWKGMNAGCRCEITDDGVLFSRTDAHNYICQVIESPELYLGKTLTLSTIYADGRVFSDTITLPTEFPTENTDIGSAGPYKIRLMPDRMLVMFVYKGSVTVSAVKLELGSVQTLASKDANGNWVLNEIPDKSEELLKCCMSTADSADTYANNKKTATAVNAVALDGSNTMIGNLSINKSTPIVNLKDTETGSNVRLFNSGDTFAIQNINTDGNTNTRRQLSFYNSDAASDVKNAIQFFDIVDGVNTPYKIYGEHNKPTPTDIGAAESSHTHTKSQITDFPTALKNPKSLTIKGNGTTLTNGTYDGSAAKTVNITASSVGAFPRYDGTLLTKNDDFNTKITDGIFVYGTDSVPQNAPFANASVVLCFGSDSTSNQRIQLGIRYGATGYMRFRGYSGSTWSPWTDVYTSVFKPTAADVGVSFTAAKTSGTKIGTITLDGTATDIYCNTGDITGVTAGDGLTGGTTSGNATLNVGAGAGISVTADAVALATYGTAATYGPSQTQDTTLSHSGTFTVPKITTDEYGRVTASNITYTLPASGNTDTQVTTTATSPSSEATWYLTGTTTSSTKTNDKLVKNTGLRASMLNGTTSTVGKAQITLGNSTASGTANNMIGNIALYSKSTSYHLISPADTTSAITHTLPAVTGTLINSGNLKNGLTKSSLASATTTTTSSRQYAVEYDNDGKLSVNVPWSNSSVKQGTSTTSSWRPLLSHTNYADYGTDPGSTTGQVYYAANIALQPSTGSIKASKVYGAIWNDYAEYREADTIEAGRVVCEKGDDTLMLASERLQPGANIVSDTFGFSIGETETAKTPIAVSGRVLAYPYEDRYSYKPGDAVCAAPNGTVSKMTREEIREYPERIVGTVSAIPNYETWGTGEVKINGRIWIKVK